MHALFVALYACSVPIVPPVDKMVLVVRGGGGKNMVTFMEGYGKFAIFCLFLALFESFYCLFVYILYY